VSKEYDKRTITQNRAMWKYFEMLAESLNDAGLDMRKTLKPEIEIPWTKNSIHDHLWVPIQEAITGKESTTDINTVEPSQVYEVLNRHLAEKFGITVEWPSIKP
jgi:hypothetical protein